MNLYSATLGRHNSARDLSDIVKGSRKYSGVSHAARKKAYDENAIVYSSDKPLRHRKIYLTEIWFCLF